MYSQVLRELGNVIARHLYNFGKVMATWRGSCRLKESLSSRRARNLDPWFLGKILGKEIE